MFILFFMYFIIWLFMEVNWFCLGWVWYVLIIIFFDWCKLIICLLYILFLGFFMLILRWNIFKILVIDILNFVFFLIILLIIFEFLIEKDVIFFVCLFFLLWLCFFIWLFLVVYFIIDIYLSNFGLIEKFVIVIFFGVIIFWKIGKIILILDDV